jgi:hypothetical protein
MSTLAQRPETTDGASSRDSDTPEATTGLPDLEKFSRCVGGRFTVDGAETALELVAAEALPSQPGAPRERPFALLFRGSPDTGLGQGVIRASHPRTGPVELFVVPVFGRGEGAYYEAIFN